MRTIDLIQPRHNYAAPAEIERLGQVYLPTSLCTAGARLMQAGADVRIHDENLREAAVRSNIIGMNLLGAPYIPEVISLQKRIRDGVGGVGGDAFKFILGGQVMSGISDDQRVRLFGEGSVNGNDDFQLARAVDVSHEDLPSAEETSLIPVYEQISDEDMKEYLSREFSLYVSQGCKFACSFCAAVRTARDPLTGRLNKVKEVYRDLSIIEKDLDYLMERALRLGLDHLDIYMSNLDVFQTPDKLLDFAKMCKRLKSKYAGFGLKLRGLATVDSFLAARNENSGSIEELVEAGFHTVGFGVDGITSQVWRAIKKGHNTEEKCIEAIRSAKQDFGITPELLMVFGHDGIDTAESLQSAYLFTQDMVDLYGAVPRPHVSKSFVPGNDGWTDSVNFDVVEKLMQNPELFQSLDFTALPSVLTHPNREIRELATEYFLRIASIPGNVTNWVYPIEPGMSADDIEKIRRMNVGRYDR